MPGWTKHKLESRLPGEISIISDMQMTPPFTESKEELKSLKFGLKFNIQKTKIMASSPITSWQRQGNNGNMTDFISLGSKITADVTAAMKLKDTCFLGEKL